jgi:signal transduction histidine kinase
MDLCRLALDVHRSPTQQAAFAALIAALGDELPLHCAVWMGGDPALRICEHPAGAELPDELGAMALHVSQPEVFPVAALSPTAGARYPDAEALLLPLGDTHAGALLLVAAGGAFGEDLSAWDDTAAALGQAAVRERLLREAREERESYRKRAQEMEALDVLGLAANQTLDPQEVVSLVARFARTLLGAHYAVVQTVEDGQVRCPAAVGLRPCPIQPDGDPFARRVIHSEKPVVLGQGIEVTEDAFPLHHAQGMHVGLGVPLTLFGETFGALVVGYRDPYPVSARDTLLALTLARHAAVAINNARLHAALADRSEELQRANEELHRTSQLKERFFAAMSHELRTPVNGILGRQNLVLDGISGEVSAPVRTQLEKANTSARTLLHLVDEILDYARLEAGKMAVNLVDVGVRGVVAEALASVEPQAAAKGIVLEARMEAADAPVRTDTDRTRQIVLNLLSNAVKFTERGAVTVSAAPVADAGGERWMEVRVRDTGPGIARADQERIFLEFEQVAGTRGGTGLGLPISRRLAQLLGGDLRVESEPGVGSTFILRLPLALTPAATPAADAPAVLLNA